jgi:hypothetical protein
MSLLITAIFVALYVVAMACCALGDKGLEVVDLLVGFLIALVGWAQAMALTVWSSG